MSIHEYLRLGKSNYRLLINTKLLNPKHDTMIAYSNPFLLDRQLSFLIRLSKN
jgi:hypothetical protein